ncbi:MAG: allophanate hydrolase, partial [Roseimicrobium sp.]
MSAPVFVPLPFEALRADYAKGASPQEVVQIIHRRIEQRGADGVWIHVPPLEELLELAASVATDPSLPLYGVPFAVK